MGPPVAGLVPCAKPRSKHCDLTLKILLSTSSSYLHPSIKSRTHLCAAVFPRLFCDVSCQAVMPDSLYSAVAFMSRGLGRLYWMDVHLFYLVQWLQRCSAARMFMHVSSEIYPRNVWLNRHDLLETIRTDEYLYCAHAWHVRPTRSILAPQFRYLSVECAQEGRQP